MPDSVLNSMMPKSKRHSLVSKMSKNINGVAGVGVVAGGEGGGWVKGKMMDQ